MCVEYFLLLALNSIRIEQIDFDEYWKRRLQLNIFDRT